MFGLSLRCSPIATAVLLFTFVLPLTHPAHAQSFSRIDRENIQVMLRVLADDVSKDYYDPKLHGVDWKAQIQEAKERIAKAETPQDAYVAIAGAFESLHDSHTFFLPPPHDYFLEYGWRYSMIGDHCYVTQVKPGSDAAAKGLKPGDQVFTINGFTPEREHLWDMKYALETLSPAMGLRVQVRPPLGKVRSVDVMAERRKTPKVTDYFSGHEHWKEELDSENEWNSLRLRYVTYGDQLIILKAPSFLQSELAVEGFLDIARSKKTLIVDLRGNSGGAEKTLIAYLAGMFEKEIKVADEVGRKQTKPVKTKVPRNHVFTGKLIVLVDSESASASEAFARVVQLEKRGIVLGDRSAGAVMSAVGHYHEVGFSPYYFYGALITVADLRMPDGNSLEHVGVTPDEVILPSAEDLANSRDPVMVRAAALAGVNLTPEKAGTLFPYEWPKYTH